MTPSQTKNYLLLLGIVLLSGCGENLTRDKAEKMIRQQINLPKEEIGDFTIVDATIWQNDTKVIFEKLQNKGLLTYIQKPPEWGCTGCDYVEAYLTEKGNQYAVSGKYKSSDPFIEKINVKIAKLDFVEITGIQEIKQSNSAEVNYTLLRKDITPFGELVFNLRGGTINKSVTFIKYDDGWRINK